MPAFEGLQHLTILAEIHVVRNLGGVIDVHVVHGRHSRVWGEFLRLASYRTAPFGRCRSGAARRLRRPRWGAEKSSSATPSGARRFLTPWSPDRRSVSWLPCR